MRIGFVLQDPERSPTGLDTYTWSLWDALRRTGNVHEFVSVMLPRRIAGHAYLRLLWEQFYLPFWALRHKIDLLHVPAGTAPVFRSQRCVLTLHDLGDEATPRHRAPLGPHLYFGRLVPWSARFAARLLCDSSATKRAAVEQLGIPQERITVVPLAPAPGLQRQPPEIVEDMRRRYGLPDPYFLQIGARIPRKNWRGALAAFTAFLHRNADRQLQFALAGGPGFGDRSIPPETEELVRRGRIRVLGHVPQEDLPALYTGALAVVLPSFTEGFGFPLVEGFACGTPAIASRVRSVPEVAGDAALYVDPHAPDSIADAMEQYATLPELRRELGERAWERRRHFSWQKTAEKTLRVYDQALGRGRREVAAHGSAAATLSSRRNGPKILFVRLDSLGDVVLTTPCFRALKRRHPTARVHVVANPTTAPVLDADRCVDRVFRIAAPWHGSWKPDAGRMIWNMLGQLRGQKYDYVVTLRRDLDDAIFARLIGGRRTLGFHAARTKPFLTDSVRFQPGRHMVENHLRLLARLGCERDGLTPEVFTTSGDAERIGALLGGANENDRLVGLAPFGSHEAKKWGVAQTATFIDALARERIVLLGGRADRKRAEAVLGRTAAPIINLVGQTDIGELCDVLRRCRLLVCVDSGPMHLAAALGIPLVAIFGKEDPAEWGPCGNAPHRVLRGLDKDGQASPRAVSAGTVLAAIRELRATNGNVGSPGEVRL